MDQEEAQEFIAPDNGGWHYTIMRDWIAVCPDVSATAARLYWIIRSIMHEKGDRKRRLSLDELCWLLPGINGKPTGETRVKVALRELEAIGLLSNPDGDVVRRWITDPATGKQTRENYRRWQVHDFPTADYQGPKSAWELLDEYPGPGWREAAKGVTASTEGRKSAAQSKSKPSPAKTQETTGHTEGRKSASSRRKSASSRRKSGDFDAVISENTTSKEPLQRTSSKKSSSLGSSTTTDRALVEKDEEESKETDKEGRKAQGRDVSQSPPEEQDNPGEAKAAALLTEFARFQPGKYLQPEARTECVRLVAERLAAGWAAERLGQHLRDWSAQAKNPTAYLPLQLRELAEAPPKPRQRPVEASTSESSRQQVAASEEVRQAARQAFLECAKPKPPSKAASRRQERSTGPQRDPERGLRALDDLLSGTEIDAKQA